MYDSQLHETDILDFERTTKFMDKWNWSEINQVGFYGGEPSINLPLYQKFMDLVPKNKQKFIITNGVWSKDEKQTIDFVEFLFKNDLYLIVSGTEEHQQNQNRCVLEIMKLEYPDAMRLKGGDIIHPMGRAKGIISDCQSWCQHDERVMRLAIHPSGNIMYQNCHGDYPLIQTIDDPYDGIADRALKAAKKCSLTKEINDNR